MCLPSDLQPAETPEDAELLRSALRALSVASGPRDTEWLLRRLGYASLGRMAGLVRQLATKPQRETARRLVLLLPEAVEAGLIEESAGHRHRLYRPTAAGLAFAANEE